MGKLFGLFSRRRKADPIYENGDFMGFTNRACDEHRTVGAYRAWCYSDSEWCYPASPCIRCNPKRPAT